MTTLNTSDYRDFDLQILTETVLGVMKGRDVFMGSLFQSSGAVTISGTMPEKGPEVIGKQVTVPYFGVIPEFVDLAEGDSGTPGDLHKTHELATVARSYCGVSLSTWARRADDDDPYSEMARQIVLRAQQRMGALVLTEAMTTPLIHSVYSATAPQLISYDGVVDARCSFGDENQDIVAMAVHSRVYADMLKLRDSNGRPLAVSEGVAGDSVPRFNGLPLIISDKVPLTGSSMATPVSSGTGSEPTLTLAGTPLGLFKLRIRVASVSLVLATATIQFSTDDGANWSAPITTAAANVALPLIDTAKDSLVGVNGKTGITAAFNGNFANADNKYASRTVAKATSLLCKRGSLAFWYNANAMAPKFDTNVRQDSSEIAVHMYAAPHLYRRVVGGTTQGVVALQHNVGGFTGLEDLSYAVA